jgi:hypothetical protein
LPELDEPEDVHFEVFKENIPVIEAFFNLDGCAWQYTGMGELIGLDYQAAHIIWTYAGVKLDAEQFKGVMLFSKTVADELRKRKK